MSFKFNPFSGNFDFFISIAQIIAALSLNIDGGNASSTGSALTAIDGGGA